jgi:hypothetical protein
MADLPLLHTRAKSLRNFVEKIRLNNEGRNFVADVWMFHEDERIILIFIMSHACLELRE